LSDGAGFTFTAIRSSKNFMPLLGPLLLPYNFNSSFGPPSQVSPKAMDRFPIFLRHKQLISLRCSPLPQRRHSPLVPSLWSGVLSTKLRNPPPRPRLFHWQAFPPPPPFSFSRPLHTSCDDFFPPPDSFVLVPFCSLNRCPPLLGLCG